jgi:hypothetical protein
MRELRTMLMVGAVIVGLLGGMLSSVAVRAADRDGDVADSASYEFWSGLSEAAKPFVVKAMIIGYQSGWVDGSDDEGLRLDGLMSDASKARMVPAASAKFLHDLVFKKDRDGMYVSREGEPDFSKEYAAYAHLIDEFYDTYPKAHDADIGSILSCLTDDPERDCADVAKHYGDFGGSTGPSASTVIPREHVPQHTAAR